MSRPPRRLVTSATGNIGSATLAVLAGSGTDPIAGVSDQFRQTVLPVGVECRRCNYSKPKQIAAALEGVDSTLLLIPFNEDMVAWGERFVSLAHEAGLRFILRISGLGAALDCPSRIGQLHGQIDEAVIRSEIPYCILRCNAFMQNFSGLYATVIRKTGVLCLPEGSARLCFIDTEDIGDAAARILLQPQAHIGKTYDLDGPEVLSNSDAVHIISSVTGKPLEYHAISADEAREGYRRFGISEWKIDALDSLADYIRDGHGAKTSPDLQALLDRPPRTFEQFARENRECWLSK